MGGRRDGAATEAARIGYFVPGDVGDPSFERLPDTQLALLRAVPGLTATVSDVLEGLGLALAVSASTLAPRHRGLEAVVGHALTLRYLPQRTIVSGGSTTPSRLAHGTVSSLAHEGDVLVIEAAGGSDHSCFGGLAANIARRAGISAAVVDGAARDLDEIEAAGLPLWSRSVTPVTGSRRLEAVAINQPICCGTAQVRAGDIVVADATGVCFVPVELAPQVIEHVLAASTREARLLTPGT
jgi:4-hydroxy-4-methyl-2-oxoglutarate aldolase